MEMHFQERLWLISDHGGKHECKHCKYKTDNKTKFTKHTNAFHNISKKKYPHVFYVKFTGTPQMRNIFINAMPPTYPWLSYFTNDILFSSENNSNIEMFGNQISNVIISMELNLKIIDIIKLRTMGSLRDNIPTWWIDSGINDGRFERILIHPPIDGRHKIPDISENESCKKIIKKQE